MSEADCPFLRLKNPCARDAEIVFVEKSHVYYLKSCPFKISVTGHVHSFFPEFLPDEVIAKMMRNKAKFDAGEYAGQTVAQIKALWKERGTQAADCGTWMHRQIELLCVSGAMSRNRF
jgi:hypothetical protein